MKCVTLQIFQVFQERAQLKRELTVLEAEEHSLATQIKQNELYLRVISGVNTESHLLSLVQVCVLCVIYLHCYPCF